MVGCVSESAYAATGMTPEILSAGSRTICACVQASGAVSLLSHTAAVRLYRYPPLEVANRFRTLDTVGCG